MLPIVTLAGFGGIASIAMLSLNPGKVVSSTYSRDGRYRVRIMEVNSNQGCGILPKSYVVLVERRWNYIKTGSVEPFCFAGSPSQLELRWFDATTLSIACTDCDEDSTYAYDQNWGCLPFAFDLQRK